MTNFFDSLITNQAPRVFHVISVISLLLASVSFSWADVQDRYQTGVTHYRQGNYQQAANLFTQLCSEDPNNIDARYYSALSFAQLGKIDDARVAYQTVIRLAPDSNAAKLAKNGLDYLPTVENGLDKPPVLNGSAIATAQAPAQATSGGMDPQMLQMMMMMGAMGGGKGGGSSMMMIPLMQSLGNQNNGQNNGQSGASGFNMSPELMQQMLEQEMMSDMGSLFDSGSNNK